MRSPRRAAAPLPAILLVVCCGALPPAPLRAGESPLTRAASPYLRSHARDAVEWRSLDPAALERAQTTERPLFLLMGRAGDTRHATLEREFLAEGDTAEVLQNEYVAVLVDRDERPDLADVYLIAARLETEVSSEALEGPLGALLTPEMRPVLVRPLSRAGPYLLRLALEYRASRPAVDTRAGVAAAALQSAQRPEAATRPLREESVAAAWRAGFAGFDMTRGTLARRPARPPLVALRLALAEAERTRQPEPLRLATRALEALAAGGIHDVVGGGFFRETADPEWKLPRFSKRLADNALLLDAFVRAHALTGSVLCLEAASGIAEWVVRELRDENGAFAFGLVEGPEGEEGRAYTWTEDEIRATLGEPDAGTLFKVFRLEPTGVLTLKAADAGLGRRALERLRERRAQRVRPVRDERLFVWANGWMIAALARSGIQLERPADIAVARRAAEALLARLGPVPALRRVALGETTGGAALLEDYAALALGLAALGDATKEQRYTKLATQIADEAERRFLDTEGGFFLTESAHAPWPVRVKSGYDTETPSPNAVIAEALLALAGAPRGEKRHARLARATVEAFLGDLELAPDGLLGMAKVAGDLLGRRSAATLAPPPADGSRPAREVRGPVTIEALLSAPKARPGQYVEARVTLKIAAPWVVVAAGTRERGLVGLGVNVLSEQLEAQAPRIPPAKSESRRWSPEPVTIYAGETAIVLPLRLGADASPGETRIRLRVRYQRCDANECQPPESVLLEAPFAVLPPAR